jgi:hypothetical protein
MTRHSRPKDDPQSPHTDELPSRGIEPAPAPSRSPDRGCVLCHRPGDDTLGPATKDRRRQSGRRPAAGDRGPPRRRRF